MGRLMIKDLRISRIRSSFKEETIKVTLKTDKGTYSALSPSGTSRSKYEAKTLSLRRIFKLFPKVKKEFIGKEESEVDKIIDKLGVNNIGANFSIALSIASIRALSDNNIYKILDPRAKYFPYPVGNVMGEWLKNSIQEFLVIPTKAKSIQEAIKTNDLVWKDIGNLLKCFKICKGRNYEGAWIADLDDLKKLELLSDVVETYGASIGLDMASSHFYKKGKYVYSTLRKKLKPDEQLDFVIDLIKTYKIIYVEDPFEENDFKRFSELRKKVRCFVVGDDLFATQPGRLKIGIRKKSGNSILIKPDQAGTVSKTLETVRMAKKHNFTTIVSHRSKDTIDSFISDFAVGTRSPMIKCGIYGKERRAKLNRLIEIWKEVENPRMQKLKHI
jgi:enolase